MNEIKTANGSIIPFIGMGTFPLQGRKMADTVKSAVKIGYRLIDTADDYRGEDGIGLAIDELIKEGFCKREDLFLQTKISANGAYHDEPLAGLFFNPRSRFMQRHSVEEIVREKVATSLMGMNTDYIDSLLIHLPYPGYIEEIWDVMIKLKNEGLVRHIGVSNFHKRHIDAIANSGVLPEFNQIYICPICTKQKQLEYYKAQGIQIMTYSLKISFEIPNSS
jgi:diketogulonate reductase-like aldo/keto reductase